MAGAHADISKHVRMYLAVFAALAVLTVLTVWVSTQHIAHPWNYVVGLGIATLKASLVALIFMHLKWERAGNIWFVLVLCAFFFLLLICIPSLSTHDLPPQSSMGTWG